MKTFYDYRLALMGATINDIKPADTFIYWDTEHNSPVNGRVFVKTAEDDICVDLESGEIVDFEGVDITNCHCFNISITADNVYLRN